MSTGAAISAQTTGIGWRRAIHIAGTVLTVAVVIGWLMFLRPQNMGGPAAYVMVSGESMEPTYQSGDFVVALERENYEIGDVIVYRVPEGDLGAGRLIIHRVIDGDQDSGFRTQGDNRPTPDEWEPTKEDIVGKLLFHIPSAGGLLPYLRSPIALASFAGLFTFLLIFVDRDKKPDETEIAATEPQGEVLSAESQVPLNPSVPPERKRSRARPLLIGLLAVSALLAGFLYSSRRNS